MRCYGALRPGISCDARLEPIVKEKEQQRGSGHRPSMEIFASIVAGSPSAAGSNFLVSGRWIRNSCPALPQDRNIGSTSDSSTEHSWPSPFEMGAPYPVGNQRQCSAGTVARVVLPTRSCRADHAEATKDTFGALLWRGARRPGLGGPCLGAGQQCRCHRRRVFSSFYHSDDVSASMSCRGILTG